MKFIKNSTRKSPRASLVLLDWSVRESFHLLHYLSEQTVPRNDFEVILIEYYSRVSDAAKLFEDQIDTWIALGMPENCYYHKHLMYNAGIVVATGDIVMIGDSDAMVKPTFIETIVRKFDEDSNIVYHIDQFRNLRRDFYPFNYPSFEEVLGEGCINNVGGKTAGIINTDNPIHSRNYGASMCAKRADLIAIGGADMHIDYLGHICGPYDMTFRLVNYGRREIWDTNEFMFHTWHPGQAGVDNYLGPHDGRHMSTTALEALDSGRIFPFAENEAIEFLRTGKVGSADEAMQKLIPNKAAKEWDIAFVEANASHLRWTDYKVPLGTYKGFRIISELGRVFAYPVAERCLEPSDNQPSHAFEGDDAEEVKSRIDAATSAINSSLSLAAWGYTVVVSLLSTLYDRSQSIPMPVPKKARAFLGLILIPIVLVATAIIVPAPLIGKLRIALRSANRAAESLTSLAIGLHIAADLAAPKEVEGTWILLVDARRSAYFLKFLCLLRVLPLLQILRVRDAEAMHRALGTVEAGEVSGQIVMQSELYRRFHATISEFKVKNGILIL